MTNRAQYTVHELSSPSPAGCQWNDPLWQDLPSLSINQFSPAGSDHRPLAQAKIAHSKKALHVLFRVLDRYVKSVTTEFQGPVCKDSCVELFVQPKADRGYFNFETNCGGAMLLYYIEDPTRVGGGFARYTKVSPEDAKLIRAEHTMPESTPVELPGPLEWRVELTIPFAMMERYIGTIGPIPGQTWRGNLYKCGDETSHPHWASWSPLGEKGSFHQPEMFGELRFE